MKIFMTTSNVITKDGRNLIEMKHIKANDEVEVRRIFKRYLDKKEYTPNTYGYKDGFSVHEIIGLTEEELLKD